MSALTKPHITITYTPDARATSDFDAADVAESLIGNATRLGTYVSFTSSALVIRLLQVAVVEQQITLTLRFDGKDFPCDEEGKPEQGWYDLAPDFYLDALLRMF